MWQYKSDQIRTRANTDKISRLFMRMRPLRYIWDASTHLSCETFAPHDPATNWPAEPEHTDLARCTFRLMREETYTTTRALKYVADSPIRGGKHRSGSGGDGPTARAAFSYTLTSAETATGGPPGPDTTIAFIIAALNIPDLGDPRFYSFGSRGGSFDDNGGVFESGSNGSGNNGNGKRRRDETEHPYRPAPPGSL